MGVPPFQAVRASPEGAAVVDVDNVADDAVVEVRRTSIHFLPLRRRPTRHPPLLVRCCFSLTPFLTGGSKTLTGFADDVGLRTVRM